MPAIRVLLDVSAVPTRPVGAGVYTVHLASGLATRDDIELHLLARRDDAVRWAEIAPKAVVHAEAPAPRPARLAWEQARGPALATRLGIELWHGPHYTLPLRIGVPAVVTVLDLTFFDHPEWHEKSKVMFFRRMIPAALRRARGAIVISQFTARRLAARLNPSLPVTVAPLGVDHHGFSPTPEDRTDDLERLARAGIRPPYVAFAGTLEPRKNVPALIEAFRRVAGGHPDLRLVIAGRDGWGATAVRDAAASSGVTTQILRTGWFPGEALPALFRQARAVAYPSLEEGFGLPALEALACGAAVVTTTGSAMEEVVGDAARLVPPGDVAALARELTDLVEHDALRDQLRAAGPARAAAYTWEATVSRHAAAYHDALEQESVR